MRFLKVKPDLNRASNGDSNMATKKTSKKAASKGTAKPSAGWVDKPNPIEVEGKAKAKAKVAKKKASAKKTPKKKDPIKADNRPVEPEATSNTPVPHKYREAYKEHNGSCGDNMSEILKAADIGVVEIGDANGINVTERWGHLNNGMQRMNLGNMLRGKVKKGESVKIGSKTIKGDK